MSDTCTCGRVKIDNEVVGRNWRAECPDHGTASEWYSRCGKAYYKAFSDHAVVMQRLAREARLTGQNLSHLIPPTPRLEDFCPDG